VRVIVAHPSAQVAQLLTTLLEGRGHEVAACASGAQAVEAFAEGIWDVLLISGSLDGVAADHVIRYARRRAGGDVRIIWTQSVSGELDRVRAYRAGADCVVTLPAHSLELLAAVEAPTRADAGPADAEREPVVRAPTS
jgi:DNA-binding response OmpR family regulator